MTNREKYDVEPTQVKAGDLMALTYWVKVKSVTANGEHFDVENIEDNNSPIHINGGDLIRKSASADQYQKEEKVGKTKAAELLVSSTNRPFTVAFLKTDGNERLLRGRLVKPEPLLGRSMVEDMELKGVNRLRQVDHRTIKYLIVDGVKYTVK
jgi:hypothetical protein